MKQVTSRTYARRLRRLADFLEIDVAPAVEAGLVKWRMASWGTRRPRASLDCGTAACAAGFATVIFADEGFKLDDRGERGFEPRAGSFFATKRGYEACTAFFGTSSPFAPKSYADPSLPNVVARLREVADTFASHE